MVATEVTSRADSQVFVAPASVSHQMDSCWGRADEMTSTDGAVEAAGTLPADETASGASNRAVAQPFVVDAELVGGSADQPPAQLRPG